MDRRETNNLEWYDPVSITTKNGSLRITLSANPEHNLNYTGGMMSTWNKFCFSGGYIETSVVLPGLSSVYGLWPAVWTMGNLGRAGYGATLDGMWPYTYDTCDLGTLANQTQNGIPAQAATGGADGKPLSYLPGQRLSACTCGKDGEVDHPGPQKSDGSWTARQAPEIDIFEAQTNDKSLIGQVSQSAQVAPFDMFYDFLNTTGYVDNYNPSITAQNTFAVSLFPLPHGALLTALASRNAFIFFSQGSVTQEATSLVSTTNQDCYQYGTGW